MSCAAMGIRLLVFCLHLPVMFVVILARISWSYICFAWSEVGADYSDWLRGRT